MDGSTDGQTPLPLLLGMLTIAIGAALWPFDVFRRCASAATDDPSSIEQAGDPMGRRYSLFGDS